MEDFTEKKPPLARYVEALTLAGVEFLIIGGQAEQLFGSARVTYDVDFCYRRTADNLQRLATALASLKPTLRGVPADLPFRLDAKSLALGSNFTFDTIYGPFDLLGHMEPLGGYDDVIERAVEMPFGPWKVKVLSLDDLIRIKEHIGRPKDRDSLMHLLAIRRLRDG